MRMSDNENYVNYPRGEGLAPQSAAMDVLLDRPASLARARSPDGPECGPRWRLRRGVAGSGGEASCERHKFQRSS